MSIFNQINIKKCAQQGDASKPLFYETANLEQVGCRKQRLC